MAQVGLFRGADKLSIGGHVYAIEAGSDYTWKSHEHVDFFCTSFADFFYYDFGRVASDYAVFGYYDAFACDFRTENIHFTVYRRKTLVVQENKGSFGHVSVSAAG